MEINKYRDIIGVVTAEAIVEGRMVLLTNHSFNTDYGSQVDLPAARLPDSSTEAQKAHYIIAFAVDNAKPPIYQPYPSFSYALRQGFDQASNVPFSADVYMTSPSMLVEKTIPSGALALAFGPGVYTVPSGSFVDSANMRVPGTWLAVATGANAGKLTEDADGSEGKFAQVESFDLTSYALTFRINW